MILKNFAWCWQPWEFCSFDNVSTKGRLASPSLEPKVMGRMTVILHRETMKTDRSMEGRKFDSITEEKLIIKVRIRVIS